MAAEARTELREALSVKYKYARPKGWAEWTPHKKTREIMGQVEEVLEQYRDHWPLTLRQIFYRLVAIYSYEKTERGYKRLGDYLVRARRAGMIPFEAIRDDGWVNVSNSGWAGPDDFWRAVEGTARGYERNKQILQPSRTFLLVEAAGMVPQMRRVADMYNIPVMSSSGFDSLTVKKGLADRVLEDDRACCFLHVGDLDPSGVCIFDTVQADVEAFVDDTIPLVWERVAITEKQVKKFDLPTAPAKRTDKRGNGVRETCQAEALPPDRLLAEVERAIKRNTDMTQFEKDGEREQRERAEVLARVEGGRSE